MGELDRATQLSMREKQGHTCKVGAQGNNAKGKGKGNKGPSRYLCIAERFHWCFVVKLHVSYSVIVVKG